MNILRTRFVYIRKYVSVSKFFRIHLSSINKESVLPLDKIIFLRVQSTSSCTKSRPRYTSGTAKKCSRTCLTTFQHLLILLYRGHQKRLRNCLDSKIKTKHGCWVWLQARWMHFIKLVAAQFFLWKSNLTFWSARPYVKVFNAVHLQDRKPFLFW